MYFTKKLSLFLFLFVINQATGSTSELNSTYIELLAKNYLIDFFPSTEKERIRISVSHLDPRIKIKACKTPLAVNIPENNNARNINVKISCNDSTSWKIYLSANVEITKGVLIAKNTISKGDKLDADNVELTYLPINRIRGKRLTDTTVIFGARAKKRIAKGRAINKKNICLVCKGDLVTIIVSSDSFNIKTQGVALTSGNINEQIRVRNSRSNKIITPRVKTVNQVVINL